jgi:small conductance mechanosensitive channel
MWEMMRPRVEELAGRLALAAVILLVGWLLIRVLVGPLHRLLSRSRLDPLVVSFLVNSARGAILVAILLAVLQQLGIQTASLLTLLGAAGLAVALSLQGSLANFASGLVLLSFRVVRVGDLIEVGDVRGRVSEMLPFHVVINTLDNQRIVVPNTLLTNGPVRNNSFLLSRRVRWTLPIAATDDLNAAREALSNRLRADPRIFAEPAPQVYVQEWTLDRRVLAVEAWTATTDYLVVQQDLLEQLGQALQDIRTPPPG